MMYYVIAVTMTAFLSGYVLGRMHRRETEQEKLLEGRHTWLIRPHTESTLPEYPLPEEQEDLATVSDASWSRTTLPNSGVRWS